MVKYMRKGKITGDVAVMEVSQSSLGVRTRAKTLALQRLQTTANSTGASFPGKPESCYLELRSRRLVKPSLLPEIRKQQNPQVKTSPKDTYVQNPCVNQVSNSGLRVSYFNSGSGDSVSVSYTQKEMACGNEIRLGLSEHEVDDNFDLGIEASFGENNLDFEGRQVSTRESRSCSLTREPDTIGALESPTRRLTNLAMLNPRNRNAILGNIPTTYEIEEFFASAERQQQRFFMEKYNFNISNDMPLPGRYEWVQENL